MSKKGWVTLACLCLAAIGVMAAGRGVVIVKDETGQEVGLYAESHALLVGVSDYRNGWARLPGVRNDLTAVKQALEAHGFQVRVVKNPADKDTLESAFEEFILQHGLAPNNRLLFYFAGHGHTHKPPYASDDPEEWMGYIVARDAPAPEKDLQGFFRNALSMKRFEGLAEQIQAKHALFMFDSCFSGTVFGLSRARPQSISYKTARPVRQFIASGSADETVPDVSVFRKQFILALNGEADGNGDRYVTGAELGEFLQDRVINYSNSTQHPQYGKIRHPRLDKGDFVFALESAPPPAPVRFLGNVQVNVNLPARVYIGNEQVGQAAPGQPLNRTGVPAGSIQVRVEAEGHQPQMRVARVNRGKWTQLVFELAPAAVVETETMRPRPAASRPPPRADPQAEEAALNLTQSQRRQLQRALNERGFAAGSADGALGPRSREALAAYQRREGQEPTGYLTAAQWSRLKTPPPEESPKPASRWNDLESEMVVIRGGCFQMGSKSGFLGVGGEKDRQDNERQHEVCVDDFKVGKYEVTQAQWRAVMGDNPSRFKDCDDCPVEQVSWNDTQAYLKKLNAQTGKGYRLPTEAEWEYACRGGRAGERYCGGNDVDALAWHGDNSGEKTHPVGGKRGNGFGLYDLSGNVWEWTCSGYDNDYSGGESQCLGIGDDDRRVLRGGSWGGGPWYVRAAYRDGGSPDYRYGHIGFRLAQD